MQERRLAGKNVGVQAASAALTLLQEDQAELAATFGGLQEFADYNSAFVELQAGSVDAVAMDVGVANYQIKTRGERPNCNRPDEACLDSLFPENLDGILCDTGSNTEGHNGIFSIFHKILSASWFLSLLIGISDHLQFLTFHH